MKHIPKVGPFHFVGIGGIGMSGIAEVLWSSGFSVTGSDLSENGNVKRLQEKGISVFKTHEAGHVKGASVVVVSTAINEKNPEVMAARKAHIPVIRRAEMLAELMRLHQSICVSGTHGKTTTTSLCAALLDGAELDPTVINGGIINAYGTNARLGKGEWFVAEADESDGSFLKLLPWIAVVTNIDPEHMEYYGTYDRLVQAFDQFVHSIPFYGLGILCTDHDQVRVLAQQVTDRRVLTYGLEAGADIQAENIVMCASGATFDVRLNLSAPVLLEKSLKDPVIKQLVLPLYGRHNIQNALVVVALALEMGIDFDVVRRVLSSFSGVKRRFTHVGTVGALRIIDDYAHHPVEVEAVLKAAREASSGEVIAVIQPHRYTRLAHLFHDFVKSLSLADKIIVCPVYSAGEEENPEVNAQTFTQALKAAYPEKDVLQIQDAASLAAAIKKLLPEVSEGSFLLCMGAGSISQWAYSLPELLAE